MSCCLGVVDAVLAGHAPLAHRGHDLEVGGQGPGGDLEADLVVALAGAAVGHGVGAVVAGGGDQVLARSPAATAPTPAGTGSRRGRWPCRAGPQEVAGELLAAVDDDGLDAPAAKARSLRPSQSPPWPTSQATVMTSTPISSIIQRTATEVSRPPL